MCPLVSVSGQLFSKLFGMKLPAILEVCGCAVVRMARRVRARRTPSLTAVREQTLSRQQRIPRGIQETFAFFSDAGNLEALTPPWLRFRVLTSEPVDIRAGTHIAYRLRLHGLRLHWLTQIEVWEPGRRFVDRQLSGPYRLWHHTHEFESAGADATIMRDRLRYAVGFGPLGRLALRLFVRRDIEAIFDYRAKRIDALLGD